MKTVTVRQIRNHFPSVLRLVQNGETVSITSRRKVVANLVPPARRPIQKRAWNDLNERIKRLESQPMLKTSGAEILTEDRDR